jgi:periplasmic divalent cation tolerance protein
MLVVFITCGSQKEGNDLSTGIVENKYAACVNTLPVSSTYWWCEKIETSDEILLICKTTEEAYPSLEEFVKKNHSYDCPEIIALKIHTGSKDYLDWINENTRSEH